VKGERVLSVLPINGGGVMRAFFTVFLCIFCIVPPLSAGTMSVTDGVYTPFSTKTINDQVHKLASDLNDEPMVKLAGNQKKMATATNSANSTLFLQGALITALDTTLVAGSVGTGVAAENLGELPNMPKNFKHGTDMGSSAAGGGVVASVIFNPDQISFMPKGFLISLTGGGYSMDGIGGNKLSYESFLFGMGVRYKLIKFGTPNPMAQMRALTVGTGIYRTSNNITYVPDDIEKQTEESNGFYSRSTTALQFDINSTSTTIPVDVVTSVNTLYIFNFIAGVGCDFTFGSTEIDVSADTTIDSYDSDDNRIQTDNPARMELRDSNSKASAPVARFKTILGVGFNFGPVKVDIPVAIYPTSGYTVALVTGVAY